MKFFNMNYVLAGENMFEEFDAYYTGTLASDLIGEVGLVLIYGLSAFLGVLCLVIGLMYILRIIFKYIGRSKF